MKVLAVTVFALMLSISALGQKTVVLTDRMDLRGSASDQGIVYQVLTAGTDVEVIEERGEWMLVQSKERVGWIRKGFILNLSGAVWPVRTSSGLPVPVVDRPAAGPVGEPVVILNVPGSPAARPNTATVQPAEPEEAPAETDGQEAAVSEQPTARCKDGTYSYAIERSGRCAGHGGVAEYLDSEPAKTETPSSNKTVTVKGYYRKDGTYVRPYTRKAPSRRKP